MDNVEFSPNLKKAIEQSKDHKLMMSIEYSVFISNQHLILEMLGGHGFLMFTENRAILCLSKAPDLRICIKKDRNYVRRDFDGLIFKKLEIIGHGKEELPGPIRQYFYDIKDNFVKIIIVTFLFLLVFDLRRINTNGIVLLTDNLLNVMSMFLSMVFVFIGFIYSDRSKAIDTYIRGYGDKYYSIDKYIMNLSIIILSLLILTSAIGNLTPDVVPLYLVQLQKNNSFIDKLISYKSQYYVCALITWFSINSMIICFSSLIDYYLNDMRNKFFADAVDEKSKRF